MDLEQLKHNWQGLDSLDLPESFTRPQGKWVGYNRSLSSLLRLKRLYRVLIIISFLWVFLFPCIMSRFAIPGPVSVAGSVFFALMGVLMIWIYRGIVNVDLSRMTVVEALSAVCRLQIMRRRHKLIGYAMMTPLLVMLLYYFYTISLPMFYGGLVGAVIGFVIGINNDRLASRWIASMKAELRDVLV